MSENETSDAEKRLSEHQVQLRGYEVARFLTDGVWEQTAHFRPTDLGRRQALADATWLGSRHPDEVYVVRPIVSFWAGHPDGPIVPVPGTVDPIRRAWVPELLAGGLHAA